MPRHLERHNFESAGWLRAAVLGANDGIISTAGLIVGVAASGANGTTLLATGLAGLVAGAMSMAAGEYVSVKSQADMEKASLSQETRELADDPQSELDELTRIYQQRGLQAELAREVARQLTAHDALAVCPDGVSPEWAPPKAAWVRANEPDRFAASAVSSHPTPRSYIHATVANDLSTTVWIIAGEARPADVAVQSLT